MQTDSLLVQWTHSHIHSENVTKTSIQRIIGRQCRCAGCRAPRPEERIWCVSNGKWRWVILALLDIMIFLFGKATQPGEGGMSARKLKWGWHLVFAVMHLLQFYDLAFYSGSLGTNLMMLISARHHLVHIYPPFSKSTTSPSYIETCHESVREHVCQFTQSEAFSSK